MSLCRYLEKEVSTYNQEIDQFYMMTLQPDAISQIEIVLRTNNSAIIP